MSPETRGTKAMPLDNELTDKGYMHPVTDSLESSAPPAGSTSNSKTQTSASLMPTSKIPQSTPEPVSMPEPPLQVSRQTVLLSGNNETSAEPQCESGSTLAADPEDSPDVPGGRWRLTDAISPSQPLLTNNRSIIAASAALAYIQNECRGGDSLPDCADSSSSFKSSTKVRTLTSLSKGLLRDPGEAIAISSDIFQSEIVLLVAHDDGNCIHPEMGTGGEKQPEK